MKIFCIGLSKTGTTSLTEALRILGFDAVHWYATKHAFRYTPDGGIDIDWDFFERHDAFADTPIARIYPQLDERYPDAKFILTVRDIDAWLESFADQFANAHLDAFSRRLHRELYGSTSFDPEPCRGAALAHLDGVRAYFQSQPSRLLELDLSAARPWPDLCSFLGMPEPSDPFPWRFSKRERLAAERLGLLDRVRRLLPARSG